MSLAPRPIDAKTGMPYAHRVTRIAGAGSRAWRIHDLASEAKAEGRDVIDLTIGDPDFDTPKAIVDAAVASMRQGRTHYIDMAGIPPLREAIARRQHRLTGQVVDPDDVVVVPGAQCGLFSTLQCLAGEGDEVVMLEPTYATYEAVVGACGARAISVPLSPDRGFHIDPQDLAAAITPRTRAILMNFPHNPTGAMITKDELAAIADVCHRRDIWLVSDEVYGSLTYGERHYSPATTPGLEDRTVVVDSLSKSHAMTGWRLGWVIARGELASHLYNLLLCQLYGCPPFVQDAAVTALTREYDEIDAMRAEFAARRTLVAERVNAMPTVSCLPPEGGMFLMIDIRATGLGSVDFAFRLFEAEGLALMPGVGFGPSGEGHLRLSLSSPRAVLDDACRRLERFLGTL